MLDMGGKVREGGTGVAPVIGLGEMIQPAIDHLQRQGVKGLLQDFRHVVGQVHEHSAARAHFTLGATPHPERSGALLRLRFAPLRMRAA